MIHVLHRFDARRGLLLAGGVALGSALAGATAGVSWESAAIGLGLLFRPLIRFALLLLFLQMPGTMLPLILLPDVCFTHFPFGLTLEGQYIIKNLILISAAIVIGGGVRATGRLQ